MNRKKAATWPTYPFDELFAIFADYAFGEANLPEADIFVHLLGVLRIERTPTATHLKQQYA